MPKKIFSIILFCFIFSFFATLNIENARAVQFKPQVSIPKAGSEQSFTQNTAVPMGDSTKVLAEYIAAIYKYLIGVIGILATITMMIGGVRWIVSGGNPNAVASAKSWIASSLTGLVLALCSYTILYLVNPELTKFKVITIKPAKVNPEKSSAPGCCQWPDGAPTASDKDFCENGTDKGTFVPNSYPGITTCIEYAKNGEACHKEDKKCVPGFDCINISALNYPGDFKCSDGKAGSVCGLHAHCKDCGNKQPACVSGTCKCI